MQQIELSQNKTAILDDEDFARLGSKRYYYRGGRDGTQGYAVRQEKVEGKVTNFYLHREIVVPPEGYEVIFLNGDRLDCRRCNLRAVTIEEARRHHKVRSDCKSGAKGVRLAPDGESWSAYLYRYGHAYHIGTYATKSQAEQAYEQALRRENPDLYSAPEIVERQNLPRPEGRVETGCSASIA